MKNMNPRPMLFVNKPQNIYAVFIIWPIAGVLGVATLLIWFWPLLGRLVRSLRSPITPA